MDFQSFSHRVVLKSISTSVHRLATHANFLPDSLNESVSTLRFQFNSPTKMKIISLIVHTADDDQDELIVNVPCGVTR